MLILLLTLATNSVQVQSTSGNLVRGAPAAVYSSEDAQGRWTVELRVGGYPGLSPDQPSNRLFIARMSRDSVSTDDDLFADSRTCPQLVGVVVAINDLFAPRFDIGPGFGAAPIEARLLPTLPPPSDGRQTTLEANARQADGNAARMWVSGAAGPIEAFRAYAVDQLEGCWTPARPPEWREGPS